jgi:hypothetical protein
MAAFHHYKKQRNIYHLSVNFNMRDDESSSPTSAIASLLGEKTSRVSHNFVLTIKQSTTLNDLLARSIRDSKEFYKLNLNPMGVTEFKTVKEIMSPCIGDRECEIKIIKGIIPGYFTIAEDEVISNWYHLNIKTLNPDTTRVFSRILVKVIKEYRTIVIQEHLENQIKMTEELIKKKKESMVKLNLEDELAKEERLKGDLKVLAEKIKGFAEEVTRLKIELKGAEKSYLQGKETFEEIVSSKDELNIALYEALKNKILTLRTDITALKILETPGGGSNPKILMELKNELKEKEGEFGRLQKKFRRVASEKKFNEKQILGYYEKESKYHIINNQYEAAVRELANLSKDKESALDKLIALQKVIEIHRPDIEYLKLLKEKELKLKILKSTIVPDLSFDGSTKDPLRYKRASKLKTAFFALILSVFALIIYLVIRFLLDQKIYNDEEFQSEFDDLAVIGETPKMNAL